MSQPEMNPSIMMYICFALITFFFSNVSGHVLENYSKIEDFGDSCSRFVSCEFQQSRDQPEHASSMQLNCACDNMCSKYGDCCIDALKIEITESENEFKCFELPNYGGIFMKDSCPPSYKGPGNVRRLCENTEFGDKKDPVGSLPVTDASNGVTYKNYYCSICNGKYENMVLWSPKLDCTLLTFFNATGKLTEEYVLGNLATDGQNWGVYLKDDYGASLFHECDIDIFMPSMVKDKIRLCKPDLISDCPLTWDFEEVRRMCKSYMGVKFNRGGKGYKNIHCAICNHESVSDLSCDPGELEVPDIFRLFNTVSFAVLMDFNEKKGPTVGQVQMCDLQEVYDPFFKRCRSVTCLSGFIRVGNKCLPRRMVVFNRGKNDTTKGKTSNNLRTSIRFSEWRKRYRKFTRDYAIVEKTTTLQPVSLQTSTESTRNVEKASTMHYVSLITPAENFTNEEHTTTTLQLLNMKTSTENFTNVE